MTDVQWALIEHEFDGNDDGWAMGARRREISTPTYTASRHIPVYVLVDKLRSP